MPHSIWAPVQAPLVDVAVLDRLQDLIECTLAFPRPRVQDVSRSVREAMERLPALRALEQGQRVAVTAGSRGISNIALILRTACEHLRTLGVEPVVVAAMGSHGGATAEGQRDLLHSLGVTRQALGGVPVLCGAETRVVGHTPGGLPVHVSRHVASGVHGILVVNRIKAHTAFHGPTESGLLKMIAVGLGGRPGATTVHGRGPAAMCEAIRSIAAVALDRLPFVGGLAVIENGYEETAEIIPLLPQEFLSREEGLLARAKQLMPRIPLQEADLLIVERLGKEISGTGMDTNVIGRRGPGEVGPSAPAGPAFRRLVVLDLTPASHGNATGIGLADFTTDRAVQSIDRLATYTNCITSTLVDRARLPLFFPDDRQALAASVLSLGDAGPEEVTIVQIADTLHLEKIRVSANLVDRLEPPPGGELTVHPDRRAPLVFDASGGLRRISGKFQIPGEPAGGMP